MNFTSIIFHYHLFYAACRDNCSIPGTLQGCYEAGDQQYCCLVYLNGQCSDKCEDNQTVNESFVCERKVEEYSVEPTSTGQLVVRM